MRIVMASIGIFCSLLLVVILSIGEMRGDLKLLTVVLLATIDVFILAALKPREMRIEKPRVE